MKHNTSELVAQVDEVSNKDPLIKIVLLHYIERKKERKKKKRGEHIQKCRPKKKMVRTNVILSAVPTHTQGCCFPIVFLRRRSRRRAHQSLYIRVRVFFPFRDGCCVRYTVANLSP